MSDEKYFIHWESNLTGLRGGGSIPLTLEYVQNEVNSLNTDFPDCKHWYEEFSFSATFTEEEKIQTATCEYCGSDYYAFANCPNCGNG